MTPRTYGLPRLRNVGLRLATAVFVVGLLVAVIATAASFVRYRLQDHDLQTVRREFPGLTRVRAYARLNSMGVIGFAILGEPMTNFGLPWPAHGDVAVPFPLVTHDAFCGTYAGAIVRFRDERVATVTESVWRSPCL